MTERGTSGRPQGLGGAPAQAKAGGCATLVLLLAAIAFACFAMGAGAYLIAVGADAARDVMRGGGAAAEGWRG